MRTKLRSKFTLLFMTCALLVAVPAVAALADDIRDGLDTTAQQTQTITAGDSTSTGFTNQYWIVANSAGTSPTGCDVLAEGDSITATFKVNTPSGVTASASSLTFDECRAGSDLNSQTVKFTSNTPGTYTIPALTKTSGTGTYTTDNTAFTLVVNDNCPSGDTSGNLQDGKCTANTAPTVVGTGAPNASGNEGSELTTSGAFSDEDGNGTLTITKVSGDGTVTQGADGAWSWSHTPNDNGSGTVVVQASDGTAPAVTDSFDWSAANVNPAVTGLSDQNASEGTANSFSLGSFTDPGDDGPWTGSVNWGDGSSSSLGSFNSPGPLGSLSHTYADNGAYTVTVTVTEAGTGTQPSGSASFIANVANANPVVGALSVTSSTNGVACLTGGNTVTLENFSFTDAGSDDDHSAKIEWGDGSTDTVDPAVSPEEDLQHTYSGLGPYTIKVTVTDNDGGSGTSSNSTNPVSFRYNVSELQDPVNRTGMTMSVFKYGSTIPLKVLITDCNNQPVNGLVPKISFTRVTPNTPAIGVNEGISTQPNDTNFLMRDAGNGQYIYNLNTKSLADGDATYNAKIEDSKTPSTFGPKVSQNFGLRSK